MVQPDGTTVHQQYVAASGEYPQQYDDISYGLVGGDGQEAYFLTPTPGAANGTPSLDDPQQRIVISEIMYHPASEDPAEEFIELLNRSQSTVSLSGWRFNNGVDFTFPDVSLAPGETVVVAADPATFASLYPGVTNYYGPWTGQLSNRGESIELVDAGGEEVDRLRYADEGDWAVRTQGTLDYGHIGWEWLAEHDGGGRSLELINPWMPNQYGKNWGSSATPGGTPGTLNSIDAADIPPLIADVQHAPAIPRSDEVVTISAEVLDEAPGSVAVSLHWRVDGTPTFAVAPMVDDGSQGDAVAGDGVFTAQVPPQTDKAVIEFFVEAIDAGSLQRRWRVNEITTTTVTSVNDQGAADDALLINGAAITPTGHTGGALQLALGSQYAQLEDVNQMDSPLGLATFTLSTWFRRTGTGVTTTSDGGVTAEPLIARGRSRHWDREELDINYFFGLTNVGGGLSLAADFEEMDTGANHPVVGNSVISASDTSWHHAAATYDGSQWNLYLDGVLDATLATSAVPRFDSREPVTVGVAMDALKQVGGQFVGEIDETWILDGALDAAGIAQLRDTNTTAGQVVGHWAFDSSTSEVATSHLATPLYQVDDDFDPSIATTPGVMPEYRIIMTDAERAELAVMGDEFRGDHLSDAQMNATFISVDGDETLVRYNTGVRNRGHGTRLGPPNNYRVNFAHDATWNNVTSLNINRAYPSIQVLGSLLHQRSGNAAADAVGVELRVNGQDLAEQWTSRMFGSYVALEVLDQDFAANHFPDDPDGNVYRFRRTDNKTQEADLRYEGPSPDAYRDTYLKGTNEAEDDYSDLIQLTYVLANAADETFVEEISQVLNLEQWLRYLALDALMQNRESGLYTGVGDDFAGYRGIEDPRFVLVPYDLDSVINQGFEFIVTHDLFRFETVDGLTRIMTHPETVRMYYQAVVDLMDSVFRSDVLDPIFDEAVTGWVPSFIIDIYKQFIVDRRAAVEQMIPRTFSVESALPVVGRYHHTTSPTLQLSGTADVLTTGSVAVAGQLANWSPRDGVWNVTLSDWLLPGVNRVAVETFDSLDGTGPVVAGTFVDVWYDDGTVQTLGGALPANTVLTAADGPYHVTSGLTVPAGVTLEIEPGASLYFDQGVELLVHGTLDAEGTPHRRIRLTSVPDAADVPDQPNGATGLPDGPPRWAGVHFAGVAAAGGSLAFADLEFAQSLDGAVGVVDGADVSLADLSFVGSHLRHVNVDSASVEIRDSQLPDMFAPGEQAIALGLDTDSEHVRVVGTIPGGGHVLIQGNEFGANRGHNPIVRFDPAEGGGPVAQILDNAFHGAGSNALQLHADAFVAGNTFSNVTKDDEIADASHASAILVAAGTSASPVTVSVARNVFQDVDHALTLLDGATALFENNTVYSLPDDRTDGWGNALVGGAINFFVDLPGVTPGEGVYASGNVFSATPRVFANVDAVPAEPPTTLQFTHNLIDLQTPDLSIGQRSGTVLELGDGNALGDARFGSAAAADFNLGPGSAAIDAGALGQDLGATIGAGAIITGEPGPITNVTTATLNVGGPGVFAYRYRVDAGPWSSSIAIGSGFDPTLGTVRTAQIELSGLSEGPHTVYIEGQDFAGQWQQNATASRSWTVDTLTSGLQINEVLALNYRQMQFDGAYPDVIEFFNAGESAVDLTDLSISDNPLQPRKFVFPAGMVVQPGKFALVLADNDPGGSENLYTGFKLDGSGEGVYLYDSLAAGGALLDQVEFGLQLSNLSIGRTATGAWSLNRPTPGAANVVQPTGDPDLLTINEWFAVGSYELDGQTIGDDFFELYNTDTLPVALGGLYLTDNGVSQLTKHRVAPLSFIAPQGWTAFQADSNVDAGADHVDFRLSSHRDAIVLLHDDGQTPIDWQLTLPQTAGFSQGKSPDGSATRAFFAQPSPGVDTTVPSAPGAPSVVDTTRQYLDLQWTPAKDAQSGIAEYQVFRDGLLIDTTTEPDYRDTSARANQTYEYYVQAVNRFGLTSAPSPPLNASIDTTPPTPPTDVAAVDDGVSSITLTWLPAEDAESGVAGYVVYRDGQAVATVTEPTFVDAGVAPGASHTYQVAAINGSGLEGTASVPVVTHAIESLDDTMVLYTRDSYLPGIPVLVRLDVLATNGDLDRSLWDATASLTVDNPAIGLSTSEVTLYNGRGSALVTFTGDADFTLTATLGNLTAEKHLISLTSAPVTTVSGYLTDPTGQMTWSGVVHVTGNVTIPQTLNISPGTMVLLDGTAAPLDINGADILVTGQVNSLGTHAQPVTFTAANPNAPWGQLEFFGTGVYEHTVITRGGHAPHAGHTVTGPVIRADGATLILNHVSITDIAGKIMNAVSGTDLTVRDSLLSRATMGIETWDTAISIERTHFTNMLGIYHEGGVTDDNDGLYPRAQLPGDEIVVRDTVFAVGDDDGIDTWNSVALFERVIVRDWGDKGISSNGGVTTLTGSLVVDNFDGVVAKIQGTTTVGRTYIDRTTVFGNYRGVRRQESASNDIQVFITNSVVHGTNYSLNETVPNSIHVDYSNIGPYAQWAGGGAGNLFDDPMLTDPAGHDYRPAQGAPVINAGDPAADPDPDGTRADMGAVPYTYAPLQVLGRHLFYNHSAFDGDDAAITAADDNAIAPDVLPLLPGQTAAPYNLSNYIRGINGLLIDVNELPDADTLSASAFEFLVGNNADLGDWLPAPAPQAIEVRQGAGAEGGDRIAIVWANGAIADRWLRVRLKADAIATMTHDDVFYFGSAPGDTRNAATNVLVTAADVIGVRDHPRGSGNLAAIDDLFDFNRDRLVDVLDRIIARNHATSPFNATRLLTVPDGSPLPPPPEPEPAGRRPFIAAGEADRDLSIVGSAESDDRPKERIAERTAIEPRLVDMVVRRRLHRRNESFAEAAPDSADEGPLAFDAALESFHVNFDARRP